MGRAQNPKESNSEQAEQKKRYLEGLKRYKDKGIPIIIDGQPCSEEDWNKLFTLKEDDGFYMGDYVEEEGRLKEIRFDKVYYH